MSIFEGAGVAIVTPFEADGSVSYKKLGELLDYQIENNKGATLPSTGGIGTTIFYVVGGVMVAGAVVFLLTKRRVAAE